MSVNKKKISNDIKETGTRIRELKTIFRETGQPRLTWQVRGEMWTLKARATKLCALRAHLRGRLHLPAKMDAMKQAEFIADILTEYEVESKLDVKSAPVRLDVRRNDPDSRDFKYRRAPSLLARLGAAWRELMSA